MSQTKAQLVSGTTAQDLTVDNINTTSINSGQTSGKKNLIINGAMLVAQRGTSSTSQDFQTVDRMKSNQSSIDEVATQAQVDVASGTTPYTLGFRKAFKFTNGNQTSGAGTGDVIKVQQRLEAQDIANSGWNYLSSSSYLTMSFWVKSSVAQNFYIQLIAYDNATYNYTFETGSLSADTWTKVTHSIPGNSNIRFDNDNGLGLEIAWYQFQGTDRTASDFALNTWAAYASGSQSPDMTSTWYTTNNATFEITGVQLEVGPTATDFEHRSFAEELKLCQRYYYKQSANNNEFFRGMGMADVDGNSIELNSPFPTTMRVAPSALEQTGNASDYKIRRSTTATCTSVPSFGHATTDQLQCRFTKSSHGFGDGSAVRCVSGTAGGFLAVSAEL